MSNLLKRADALNERLAREVRFIDELGALIDKYPQIRVTAVRNDGIYITATRQYKLVASLLRGRVHWRLLEGSGSSFRPLKGTTGKGVASNAKAVSEKVQEAITLNEAGG